MTWTTQLDRAHPLVGRVWDCRRAAYVEADAMLEVVGAARIVLLGEKHDNPDHHRLQARVLQSIVARGRRPALAFEMLETDQQPDVDRYRADPSASARGLGAAIGWDKSGWPPFDEYLPIFSIAFQNGLAIVAANLPKDRIRGIVHHGTGILGAEVARLALDPPVPAPLEESLRKELAASHCGKLPDEMFAPMALAQHVRDAEMARVLLDADRGDGAVLIAGSGHARSDRGVPFYIARQKPGARVASIAWLEVEKGVENPAAHAEGFGAAGLPFDFVWFTPRANDDDPCAAFGR